MWGAEITGKQYGKDGVLQIQVKFSKAGADPIVETIDMTGGSEDVLDIKIKARLETLNTTDELVSAIPIGTYTPKPEATSDRDTFLAAYRKLERLARAADLGLIEKTDKDYVEALNEAKASYSIDFMDLG
jgi:isopentenyl diphosphate isomerase/L-lactate dehydrogenase-like FMN-dependent dehydrogenase